MKTRTLFTTLAIPATAVGLLAQDIVTVDPETAAKRAAENKIVLAQGAIGAIGFSSGPENVRFMTQEFSFSGRVVTGQPYSADEKTESVQTLSDDTHITNTTTARIYRDSQGRTRRELTLPEFKGEGKPHVLITINDPVSGVNYTLDPESKVAHKMTTVTIASAKMKAEAEARESEARARIDEAKTKAQMRASTGSGYQVVVRNGVETSPEVRHEELGGNVVEGVSATGTRDTSVIAAGRVGNDKPITIVSERWYSPDLQMEVKSVRNDPRMGQTTHTLTNINRNEPDPSLFAPPADYQVEEGGAGMRVQKLDVHHN